MTVTKGAAFLCEKLLKKNSKSAGFFNNLLSKSKVFQTMRRLYRKTLQIHFFFKKAPRFYEKRCFKKYFFTSRSFWKSVGVLKEFLKGYESIVEFFKGFWIGCIGGPDCLQTKETPLPCMGCNCNSCPRTCNHGGPIESLSHAPWYHITRSKTLTVNFSGHFHWIFLNF